jgi:glycine dehydrogenase
MYAVYHGPEGLKNIASKIHAYAVMMSEYAKRMALPLASETFFDTVKILTNGEQQNKIRSAAEATGINFRYFEDGSTGISFGETIDNEAFQDILNVFAQAGFPAFVLQEQNEIENAWSENLVRKSPYLTHEVFNRYHIEHEMLRYIKRLESKDLSMVHSMISLGSCTMKLNATAEMMPLSWSEINSVHPFVPANQAKGYAEIIGNLSDWLCEITGFAACSLQPNSGAQGEYAGLMVIRAYHMERGDTQRNVALIPSSAHGTNPASAVMAGMHVVIVKCDEKGNIDVADLEAKAEQYKETLSCLMVTYPSTHGVYEESIRQICDIIHRNGGRVYMDGANMNAQVGLTSPANIGADVCHLNLHKTFCIPHGGGGPGMGPICVVADLAPYLPAHPLVKCGGEKGILPVSAAPFGSASILTISYAYIAMMGGANLTKATKMAILNANYIKERLKGHYDVLYTGTHGRVAHEMILDCREFKKYGVEVEDIAKRLMDYGYHAPTVSFPVAGTLMVEPTESESKEELDNFINVLIEIRKEIQEIADGKYDQKNNVLKNAPHTQRVVLSENWDKPYGREKAAFPMPHLRFNKFWPSVSRIDSAYGDRNLVCSCAPVEAYQA